MMEFLTEVVFGVLVLGMAIMWIPHELSIRALRKDLDQAREEIQELRGNDGERDTVA